MSRVETKPVPSEFQQQAVDQIRGVLSDYLSTVPLFKLVEGENSYFVASFHFAGEQWEFEIYRDVAYVECARGRWDSDIFGRNPPDEIERLNDFIHRLDRLLSGGGWFTPEDKGLPDRIITVARKLFRLQRH